MIPVFEKAPPWATKCPHCGIALRYRPLTTCVYPDHRANEASKAWALGVLVGRSDLADYGKAAYMEWTT